MRRALALVVVAALGLGCEPIRSLNLSLPDGIERDEVLLELAVYVAATPNITCEALELGLIDALQILPTRVLVASVDDTAVLGSVPRDERRLVVGSAFAAEDGALVAKGCVELGPRENGARDLPLVPAVEARFARAPTVVARVDGEAVVYDEDLELTADQNLIVDLTNPLLDDAFIEAPLRLTVRRSGELIREETLEDTAGRIPVTDLGVDGPGFYRVELRPRWSAGPLALDVGAFVFEERTPPALSGASAAELTTVDGAAAVVSRAVDVVTFSPLSGDPVALSVPADLAYVGHAPDVGALFAEPGVGLHLAPAGGGAVELIPSAAAGAYKYPLLRTAGCPDGQRYIIARAGAVFTFVDQLDLDDRALTEDPGGGGLTVTLGPSACARRTTGGETRVGLTQTNAFGILIAAAASGERFEEGLPAAEVLLTTPTTLATTLSLGRDGDGAVLLSTPDFEGVSVSAYHVDLDAQALVRQREAMLVPVPPVAVGGGDAGLEAGGTFDVALSHLGDARARLDVAQGDARAVLPVACDPPPEAAPLAPPPCQLAVIDVDDDGSDEIVLLRALDGALTLDVISLDP